MCSDLAELFQRAPVRQLSVGDTLFRRDDSVENAFLVRQGRVLLQRALKDGGILTLHTAQEGDLVAEASLFADRYHCDAIIDDQATLAVLSRQDLLLGIASSALTSDLAMKSFERTARELQKLRTRIEIMRLRKVKDRLNAYLELYGPPEEGSWVRVADWIGVTPPALYRELSKRRS